MATQMAGMTCINVPHVRAFLIDKNTCVYKRHVEMVQPAPFRCYNIAAPILYEPNAIAALYSPFVQEGLLPNPQVFRNM